MYEEGCARQAPYTGRLATVPYLTSAVRRYQAFPRAVFCLTLCAEGA